MLQDLGERVVSGRIRVPIRVLWGIRRRREREGAEMATMRREGRRSGGLGFRRRKGGGRGGDGVAKLSRSSSKNLDGGGSSVSTSSIFAVWAEGGFGFPINPGLNIYIFGSFYILVQKKVFYLPIWHTKFIIYLALF